jgi:hypothetical protein
MTSTTFAPTAPIRAIPLREWLPWAVFAGLVLSLAIYFVGAEQGATSLISGTYVHEFVHDGRQSARLSLPLTDSACPQVDGGAIPKA